MARTLTPGDRVLVVESGPLAALWAGIAQGQGLAVELFDTPTEAALARHLGADRFGAIKAVLLVVSEGAIDPAAARRALDGCFHDALLLVDASAAPCPGAALRDADIALTDPEAGLARLADRPACAAE
jgi:alanine-glyoxylate transaminase/serine-glyoxylate transaminase/serine-pyruvate transaminase